MSELLRPVIFGCSLGLLGVGVFGLRFACNLPDFREEFRSAKLAEMRRTTLTRLEARDQVVRNLIAQRYSLAEAINQFRELDRQGPGIVSKAETGQSRQEKNYQFIHLMVEDVLQDHPERASLVLRRLERDYEKLRAERQTPSTTEKEPAEPGSLNTKR
jgi:hypothetical protein